nr:hypothetical protein [Rhodococcus sp. (in: high G+C Gram-positive bacteria)]
MSDIWYVNENNLVGGYIVGTVNKLASELSLDELRSTVCETVTMQQAMEIADLHNETRFGGPKVLVDRKRYAELVSDQLELLMQGTFDDGMSIVGYVLATNDDLRQKLRSVLGG